MERSTRTDRRRSNLFWAGCLLVIVSLLTGAVGGGVAGYLAANRFSPPAQSTVIQPVANTLPADSNGAAAIDNDQAVPERQAVTITEESASVEAVERVLPAVVTVITQGFRGGGSGSGFIISEDGYVVSNNHVVEGGQDFTVIYAQGGTVPAELIGTAPEFDLAVLKVEGAVPAVTQWGDSSELPLGANVIAIGSALGRYQNTVTGGILSGFNRELGGLRGLLQTDAAINQGNSGGPLINLGGQVVGINTLTVRGGFSNAEGIGFAIPSNVARTVVRRLIETGEVKPSFLGIQYQDLNPQLASDEQLSVTQGALLQDVIVGTPASQAGLVVGDVIVAINGKPVTDRTPLVSLLIEHVAGDSITLDILRDGETFQTALTLGERA